MNLTPATPCPHPPGRVARAEAWEGTTIVASATRCRDCGADVGPYGAVPRRYLLGVPEGPIDPGLLDPTAMLLLLPDS